MISYLTRQVFVVAFFVEAVFAGRRNNTILHHGNGFVFMSPLAFITLLPFNEFLILVNLDVVISEYFLRIFNSHFSN